MSSELHPPTSIAIIMDGNRRWAKNKGLPTTEGHREGGKKLKEVVMWSRDAGIKHVVFFTFSTENWKRTEDEVSYLLALIGEFLKNELENFHNEGGVLHTAGDMSKFSSELQKIFVEAVEKTAHNSGTHIYFALNYGGRAEILNAVQKIVSENTGQKITEEYFAQHLQTYPMPDPDIIIRTSGEKRLSGFLPWQGVYSELFFTGTLWPDFTKEEFLSILDEFTTRERRVGT